MTFKPVTYPCNGQQLHTMTAGPADAPVILMLHGFPEYWVAWANVATEFSDRYRVILPDQRGYNLSSKPLDRGAYATKHLVADMLALIDHVSPDLPVVLCGHDWGASVAYALAMHHGPRISHLIIANGVHPMCFQKALFAAGPQTAASQYMSVLRAEGSEEILSTNSFEKMLGMLKKFSSTDWLNEETAMAYRDAWSHPGAMSAMLNWYRGSPMIVPAIGEPMRNFPLTAEMTQKYRISIPHLLLWGEQDTALLMESREDLSMFCDDLNLSEHPTASHWILHEQPGWVALHIDTFLKQRPLR